MANGMGVDNWLYIAADAIRRYVEAGGKVALSGSSLGVVIVLDGVVSDDGRLPVKFKKLIVNGGEDENGKDYG